MNVAALVGDIPTTTITIETYDADPIPNGYGEIDHGAPTLTEIEAVVFPPTPDQLERLPSADNGSGAIAVYSRTAIPGAGGTSAPSVVQYAGRRYEIHDVEDYLDLAGIQISLAVLVDE